MVNATCGVAISLSRANRQYNVGETIRGTVVITCRPSAPSSSSSSNATSSPSVTTVTSPVVVDNVSVVLLGTLTTRRADGSGEHQMQLLHRKLHLSVPCGEVANTLTTGGGSSSGSISTGVTELPFELPLSTQLTSSPKQQIALSGDDATLYESYHGLCVRVKYTVQVELAVTTAVSGRVFDASRWLAGGSSAKMIRDSVEIIVIRAVNTVADPDGSRVSSLSEHAVNFVINPERTRGGEFNMRPRLRVRGRFDSVTCRLDQPLSGHFVLEQCDPSPPAHPTSTSVSVHNASAGTTPPFSGSVKAVAPPRVRSVELQLVRSEHVLCLDPEDDSSGGKGSHSSEVQSLQVAVLLPDTGQTEVPESNVRVPLHMVFPRLFTCASTHNAHFKLDFSVNIILLLDDSLVLTENFPLCLYRPS